MKNPKPEEWLVKDYSQDYIADYKLFSFVDGGGIRNNLYVSGCLLTCEGCFNKATQDFQYDKPFTSELEEQIVADLRNDYMQGLTLFGGEPFLNTDVRLQVVRRIRKELDTIKDIWLWTSYTLGELLQGSENKLELLSQVDILIDGRSGLSKHDPKLQFRGSSSQRITDVRKPLESNRVMVREKYTDATETYKQIKKQDLI